MRNGAKTEETRARLRLVRTDDEGPPSLVLFGNGWCSNTNQKYGEELGIGAWRLRIQGQG